MEQYIEYNKNHSTTDSIDYKNLNKEHSLNILKCLLPSFNCNNRFILKNSGINRALERNNLIGFVNLLKYELSVLPNIQKPSKFCEILARIKETDERTPTFVKCFISEFPTLLNKIQNIMQGGPNLQDQILDLSLFITITYFVSEIYDTTIKQIINKISRFIYNPVKIIYDYKKQINSKKELIFHIERFEDRILELTNI